MISAVLSDIHGRLDAFLSVLGDPLFRKASRIFFLGDMTGYGPDPAGCGRLWLSLSGRLPCFSVAGNHELLLAEQLDKRIFSRAALQPEEDQLPERLREKLTDLPPSLTCDDSFLCHGSPSDPCEYLSTPSAVRNALKEIGTCRWLLTGHTHIPMAFDGRKAVRIREPETEIPFRGNGPFFLNPGSVGLPRDGIPGASYCLLDHERQTAIFRRIAILPLRNQHERLKGARRGRP